MTREEIQEEARQEMAAEMAAERYLEDRGYEEARAQEAHEFEAGVW